VNWQLGYTSFVIVLSLLHADVALVLELVSNKKDFEGEILVLPKKNTCFLSTKLLGMSKCSIILKGGNTKKHNQKHMLCFFVGEITKNTTSGDIVGVFLTVDRENDQQQ